MTETPSPPAAAKTASGGSKLLVDVGPVIAFVLAYNIANRAAPGTAVFWATGVYMAAMAVSVGYSWITARRIPIFLAVTSVIVLVFGVLTLAFRSPEFAYVKPTVINGLLAALILGSLLVGQNIWRIFFESAFELTDRAWRTLALRWAGWFVFLALLNLALWPPYWQGRPEAFWLALSGGSAETFWANFKIMGVLPLTFLFALANVPLMMRHASEPKTKEAGPAE